MSRNGAPQRGKGKCNETMARTLLIAWTLYIIWNIFGIQKRYKVDLTQPVVTKLVHGFSLNCVLFKNEREENIGVYKGLVVGADSMCFLQMRKFYLEHIWI